MPAPVGRDGLADDIIIFCCCILFIIQDVAQDRCTEIR